MKKTLRINLIKSTNIKNMAINIKLLQIFLLCLCPLLFSGCIAAGIGLAAAAISDDSDEKNAFHKNNVEREKAGLKPLTKEQWEEMDDGARDKIVNKSLEEEYKSKKISGEEREKEREANVKVSNPKK